VLTGRTAPGISVRKKSNGACSEISSRYNADRNTTNLQKKKKKKKKKKRETKRNEKLEFLIIRKN
jgi:hypothetical protein